MRLIDADAYSAEMKDRQEAAWKWRNEAIAEEDEVKLARAEGAFTAFTEAKLTMDKHIVNPWHRVEDELPNKDEFVLAYEDGTIVMASFDGSKWWQFDLYELIDINPSYWCDLPEPPKEDA